MDHFCSAVPCYSISTLQNFIIFHHFNEFEYGFMKESNRKWNLNWKVEVSFKLKPINEIQLIQFP